MKALKLFLVILAVLVTSCYFFPFVLTAFPVANSKMVLAAVGVVLLGINLTKKGNAAIDRDFLTLSVWSFAISLIAFVSITLNHTPDDTFTTYFMSMWVWLGGAYAVVSLIKYIHSGISVPLMVNYLLAVCVSQCILALIFDNYPSAMQWHSDTFTGEAYMSNTDEDRLHGIGCALDVAGFRFASVIVMTCFLAYYRFREGDSRLIPLYFFSVVIIAIVGDMISRSTIIGVGVGILFLGIVSLVQRGNGKLLLWLAGIIIFAGAITMVVYNTDSAFRENFRFGFEGFFSLAEKGEWQTNSNDILKNMVVWPDNFKTWIIGDGYINNPADKSLDTFDPYYTGEYFGGYYKGTDIGYLRYIFYFGILGLVTFSIFFIQVCRICVRRFESFKWLFIMVLAINFIEWFKVSTDLFVIFAPFLCISAAENKEYLGLTAK